MIQYIKGIPTPSGSGQCWSVVMLGNGENSHSQALAADAAADTVADAVNLRVIAINLVTSAGVKSRS